MSDPRRALVVVDVQNDFCEGGALAVDGGAATAARITDFLAAHRTDYDVVVATKDWHVDPGPHFAAEPDYRDSWPRHCVAGTAGAELHPALGVDAIDTIVHKGETAAAYSGFEAHDEHGRALTEILATHRIEAVDVVGIATDYCVRATALDARANGFATRVFDDLTAGVAAESSEAARAELRAAGVEVTRSAS